MPVTVVFVHAHPDDEALLTGGTMARLAAEGNRVVLVTATDGGAGLAAAANAGRDLATVRVRELGDAARALGVSRVVRLGYADSGLDGHGTPSIPGHDRTEGRPFAQVPLDEPAERVAAVLAEEGAGVVVGYDASGGYGHPDHMQVHRVARRAAELAKADLLLEATRPRGGPARAARAAYSLRHVVPAAGGLDIEAWRTSFTPKRDITHRINVREFLPQKRAALAAHASQATADEGDRLIAVLLRLPKPAFRAVMGTEWFRGPHKGAGFYDDVLATLNRREHP